MTPNGDFFCTEFMFQALFPGTITWHKFLAQTDFFLLTVEQTIQTVQRSDIVIQAKTLYYPKWNQVADTILDINKYF